MPDFLIYTGLILYSGTYESSKLFNPGTNNEPSWNPIPGSKKVEKVTQALLFIVENHLSHNFTPRFWVVGNLRFQQGGQTSADGVEDGNTMSILGGGAGLGYQILPFLGAYADYGGIIIGDNDAKSNMFRLSVTFAYLNKKKPEAEVRAKAMAATPVVVASVDSDNDGDGINDEEDKCPNTGGISGNSGCPEMMLYYKRAESALSADDKAQLDKVVTFLQNKPDLSIIIEGHTSTLGVTEYNLKLSEKRPANSVKYLVSKVIEVNWLKSVGYGEQFPIGDNSKEEGHAQSRRTVIKIAQ
ncbi:OmpA family protein [Flavihumibacter profundi]|uniref:OmpA family protein n=1 Tax=Flavihumibacter profundi TaxID=2716883 RepID=UPI001CC40D60|nr:OmpA family protein [Flavihumibacter profundi]MBZ5856225.1 OmpA family protein [Flavihumibacter profundi]